MPAEQFGTHINCRWRLEAATQATPVEGLHPLEAYEKQNQWNYPTKFRYTPP